MWPMNSPLATLMCPDALMWPDAPPSAPLPTLPTPCILKSCRPPLHLILDFAQLRITRSGIRQEFRALHRKHLLPKVLATSATFNLATSATFNLATSATLSLAKFHLFTAAVLLILLTAGCGPAAAPSKVHINRSNQPAQQAAANWDEQFEQVLAGESDTLIVEAEPITATAIVAIATIGWQVIPLAD